MTMGDSNKNLYAKMIVDVVLGPVLEKVIISELFFLKMYTKRKHLHTYYSYMHINQ